MSAGVVLVDGKNALYRSAMGTGWLQPGYEGERGAAVHGFIKALVRAAEACAPSIVVVVWEGESNWRLKAWPEYKAHRKPKEATGREMEAELGAIRIAFQKDQATLRTMLSALGVRQAWPEDGEADDAMAALADRLSAKRSHDVTIWTGDHDLLQCVRAHDGHRAAVRVIVPGSAEKPDRAYESAAEVVDKMGVAPALVPDLKAIEGDASDNMPGVPGLGRVAAVKLLGAHRDLEGVITAARAEVGFIGSARQRTLIVEHADEARMFKRLASLDLNAHVLHAAPAHNQGVLLDTMRELGLRSMARQGWLYDLKKALGAPRTTA